MSDRDGTHTAEDHNAATIATLTADLAAARAERDEAVAERDKAQRYYNAATNGIATSNEMIMALEDERDAAQERERAAIAETDRLKGVVKRHYTYTPNGERAAIQRAEAAEKRSTVWKRAAKAQRECVEQETSVRESWEESYREEFVKRRAAESDNAALLEDWRDPHHRSCECERCERMAQPHPGSAVLARLRAAEGLAKEAGLFAAYDHREVSSAWVSRQRQKVLAALAAWEAAQ